MTGSDSSIIGGPDSGKLVLCALAGSKRTSIALKFGLRLMKGEQSKDCQKSDLSLPVVELSAK